MYNKEDQEAVSTFKLFLRVVYQLFELIATIFSIAGFVLALHAVFAAVTLIAVFQWGFVLVSFSILVLLTCRRLFE